MKKSDDKKMTILVVDDEADVRDVLELTLLDSNYYVVTSENGVEALEVFKEKKPEIVLTDIKMPNMDGIELLRKIKHENPETEVIMITGHGDMHLAIESLKNEATDFITKPINVDALDISVKRAGERIVMRQKLYAYTESLERIILEKTELQEHLSSLGLMLSSISHGIKGLLTGLDGGMYMLNTGLDKNDQARIDEGRGVINMIIGQIRKMVLDILFYAKKRELKLERVNLKKFVSDVAQVIESKMAGHGIAFERLIDPSIEEVEMDPGFVQEALVNILENAVDACIKDTDKAGHHIIFSAEQSREHMVFSVCDDGIGMDEETREKIFTLFFSSKGRKGTGLGLFISEKNIQQHGGAITVTSAPANGSTFKIKIPKGKINENP
ncbi:MAG: hybrid sensor histidine kinase/response regulator [Deltaproteobacteria bacterium]|nr:hybrid sensor histidine kinase/response regulator [Deltaproteobacteria bacterium]